MEDYYRRLSGTDPGFAKGTDHGERAALRAYNGGMGAQPPRAPTVSRDRAPDGQGRRSPEAENLLSIFIQSRDKYYMQRIFQTVWGHSDIRYIVLIQG